MEVNIAGQRVTINSGSYTFMPVPGQGGGWSKDIRKVMVEKVEQMPEDRESWATLRIQKGYKNAGKKFLLRIPWAPEEKKDVTDVRL